MTDWVAPTLPTTSWTDVVLPTGNPSAYGIAVYGEYYFGDPGAVWTPLDTVVTIWTDVDE